MFYELGTSKSDIARETKLSVTHVSRLLKEGIRSGVVEIKVKPPTIQRLEADLIRAFGLRNARVVPTSINEETLLLDLGGAAATMFDEIASDGASVGVGSGRTLFEMASSLPECPRNIAIYPLNLVVEQELEIKGVTANSVATIVWFRSRPSARATRLEMFFPRTSEEVLRNYAKELSKTAALAKLQHDISNLDIYFLGASEVRESSALVRLTDQMECHVQTSHAVGDVGFNLLDSSGKEVDMGLGEMVVRVPTSVLTKHVLENRKQVALIAGGQRKRFVIAAALAARLCNILVTDSDVAEYLLVSAQREAAESISPVLKEDAHGMHDTGQAAHISTASPSAAQE